MIKDKFGQLVFSERDLCDLYMKDQEITLKNVLVTDPIIFPETIDLKNIPHIIEYKLSDQTISDFDSQHSSTWFMPQEYIEFDIASWVLDQCNGEAELQRAGEELIMFQERDMFVMLRYMKYLVDTMRQHNIIWGVGRGSSVSSFVLFLIGVHKINSLYYDLPITDFLK